MDINPFFHFPVDDSCDKRACWGTTFTLAALKWLQMLKWPGVLRVRLWIDAPFLQGTDRPCIPASHSTRNVFAAAFITRRRWVPNSGPSITSCALSTILGQEVMPWHKATKTIGALFGVAVHGVDNARRPPCAIYEAGRQSPYVLWQSTISPVVEEEDLSLQPATIRANYMRYIKLRVKRKPSKCKA